jgi:hypothetical protein
MSTLLSPEADGVKSVGRAVALASLAILITSAMPAAVAALSVPVPFEPANGSTVGWGLSLAWQPVAGADSYRVEISTDPGFFGADSIETVASRYDVPSPLVPGTHYWRVATVDNGTVGAWATSSFSVVWTAPQPTGPADGAVFAFPAQVPALAWTDTGARTYDVELSGPTGTFIQSSPWPKLVISYALAVGTWSWRVRAGTGAQSSSWSTTRTFVVDWPNAVPTIVGPPNGSSAVEPLLDWNPVIGAVYYDLQIVTALPFPATSFVTQRVTATEDAIPKTTGPGTYFWRVRARVGTSNFEPVGSWSSGRSYTKLDWMAVPAGLSPSSGPSSVPPTLHWQPVPEASRYEVQVASDPADLTSYPQPCFTEQAAASFSTAACLVLHVPSPGDVFWRVRPVDEPSHIEGGWSSIAMFSYAPTTVVSPIAAPIAATPIGPDDCVDVAACDREPEMPILSWSAVADAAFYRVQLSSNDQHAESQTYDTTSTEFLPDVRVALQPAGAHWTWQVIACGSPDECPTWTPAGPTLRRFIIGSRPVNLASPAQDATLDGDVALGWDPPFPEPPAPGLPWPPVHLPETYWLQLDDEPSFDVPRLYDAGRDSTRQLVDGLPAGTIYWRVRSGDTWSATRSFSHVFSVDPSGPADGATRTQPITLSVTPAMGAAAYSFAIDGVTPSQGGGDSPQVAVIPSMPLRPGTYTWHARPIERLGHLGSSSSRTFKVDPATVGLISPRNGMTIATIGTSFEWARSPLASYYLFEVSTDQAFSSIVQAVPLETTRYVPTIAYPAGPLFWRVTARRNDGGDLGASPVVSVTAASRPPDSIGPSSSAPTRAIQTGTVVSGRVPLKLSWTASDASSIGRYEVAQRTDGGPWVSDGTSLTATSLLITLLTGHTYEFRVRAVDTAGNVGAWKASTAAALSRYSETSKSIRYAGTWSLSTSAVYWTGKAKVAKQAGARATLSFSGRSVGFVSRLGPTRGTASIYVDGVKVALVNLHAASAKGPQLVWSRTWSTSKSHTLAVRVSGTVGHPSVVVDAFVVGK